MTTVPNGTRLRVAVACLLTVTVLCGRSQLADGARVLAFQSVAAKSHWYFMRGVLRALVDAGHHVKVYTPFPASRDRNETAAAAGNYIEVDTRAEYELTAVDMDATVVSQQLSRTSTLIPFLTDSSRYICDLVDKLLPDSDGGGAFDLFITEPLSDECASYATRRLGVPLIYTIPAPPMPWIETGVFGHYANPSYVQHMLYAYTVHDSFYRRLCNVALHIQSSYLHYRTTAAAAAVENRPYDRVPPIKPSMVFVNTHYITEHARPVPADRMNVGGIHLKKPEPLPAVSIKTYRHATVFLCP